MPHPPPGHRTPEGGGHVILHQQVGEAAGTVFPGEGDHDGGTEARRQGGKEGSMRVRPALAVLGVTADKISTLRLWMARVHPDDRVTGSACRLDVANHAVIALDHVIAWHPRRLSYPRDASRLEQNLALARRHATAAFGHPLECTAWSASARLQRLSTQLCEALSNRDREAARLHGRALLGLGPGLTPSGDDFLLGLFAVLHIDQSPCARFRGLCTDIVEDLEHRTNAISAAALTAAAQGRVRETIDTLLSALMTGDEATVRRALDRVLRIGSTSGRDIVSGIVAGFDANLQATESRSVRVDG